MPEQAMPIYFGGSFNPFHKGHAAIVLSLQQNFPASKIILLPNSLSPFKILNRAAKNTLWPNAQQKKTMLQIALRELDSGSNMLQLEDYELLQQGPCYTADTLQAVQTSPKCYFALGWDSFTQLPKWKNWQYLADTCHFLVFQRGAQELPKHMLFERIQYQLFDLDIPCSSSQLRCLYAKYEETPCCLSPAVAAYIEELGLYRES